MRNSDNVLITIRLIFGAIVLLILSLMAFPLSAWLTGLTLVDMLMALVTLSLVVMAHTMDIRTSYGRASFVGTIAISAYLTLGHPLGLVVVGAGLLIGSLIDLVPTRQKSDNETRLLAFSYSISRLGTHGLSLLAAHGSYLALGSRVPLVVINAPADFLPVIVATVVYLIVYNALLIGHLALRRLPVIATLVENRRTLLGLQLLPVLLPPFAAVTLHSTGPFAFILLAAILAAMIIVLNVLTSTQRSIQRQYRQLQSYTEFSRVLRLSLEMDVLLDTVYAQVRNLLNVANMQVVLTSTVDGLPSWRTAFAVEQGQRVNSPADYPYNSFTAQVLKTGSRLIANDPVADAGEIGVSDPPDTPAWAGIPLLASGRLMGAMAIWLDPADTLRREFTDDEIDMLLVIVAQASVAIENAMLYEDAQLTAAQMARLNEISAMLNASLNPERLLETVCSSVIEVVGCDKAAIYLMESEADDPRLLLAQAHGFSPEHIVRSRDIAVPLTPTERGRIFNAGETVVVSNVSDQRDRVSAGALVLSQEEGFKSYAYLPLVASKSVIGMLAVYYSDNHFFTEREIELLRTFANQAAMAVSNARIYQHVDIQLTRRIGQIVRMSDIAQRLSSTLDMETIFNLIIDSALEGCGADAGVLVLTEDPELGRGTGNALNMVAWRGLDPASPVRAPHLLVKRLADSKVFESGEPLLYSGEQSSNYTMPNSHMSVPVLLEDRVIGAISLESDVLHAFNPDDLAFVSQLAVQAAVAIRNAQLYHHSQAVRDRLSAILDASNDGLLMIDPKSRIVMTNTRMKDFWDFARQDFSPSSPEQFLEDPLSALGEGLGYRTGELNELLGRGIRNPNMKARTDLYVTGNSSGPQRFVERTATPVQDESGNFIGLLLLFRDVTDQKELEETRRNLTELIVHDLRAPLQAIMGSMRLIDQTDVIRSGTGRDRKLIDQAMEVSERALKKLLNMVNNLLDLSRMEHGEIQIDTSIEDVPTILNDTVLELRPLTSEVNAIMEVEVPGDDLPSAMIDRGLIERVVLNLADNALKYSEPGTLIKLRARVAVHNDDPVDGKREQMIRVDVLDQGSGIPDEFKSQIFERFKQVPGRTSKRASAGLGLNFCRLAIESHGGRIWVEDNPEGRGSVFSFTLPIAHLPAEAIE